MPKVVRHLGAFLATALWLRLGFFSVLIHSSSFLSGGSCFVGDIGTTNARSLDDAYFAVSIPRLSWFAALCGALIVALPAALLAALIRRGYLPSWSSTLLAAVAVVVGSLPFVFCRFGSVSLALGSGMGVALVLLFTFGLSFLVYWIILGVPLRFQKFIGVDT